MAFCGKCGAKIEDGVKFCPSCGGVVSEKKGGNNYVKEKSRLIYESKGRKGSALVIIIIGVIFIVAALLFWSLIGFEIGDIGSARMLGGYRDNGVIMEALAGFVFIGFGAYYIRMGLFVAMCWVKIYTDHIEAYAYGGKFINLRYDKIDSAQIHGTTVIVMSGGDKIKLLCDNMNKVFDCINERIAK